MSTFHKDPRLDNFEQMLRRWGLKNPNGKPLFDVALPPTTQRRYSMATDGTDFVLLRVRQPVTVYKKVLINKGDFSERELVAKLTLPPYTLLMLNTGGVQKQRVSRARVVSIEGGRKQASSGRTSFFVYRVGQLAKPDSFDKSMIICSNGIHVFFTRALAKAYEWN